MDHLVKIEKNSDFIIEIFKIFNSIHDKFEKYGISKIEMLGTLCCIRLYFDLTKISDDSFVKKNNLNVISISYPIIQDDLFSPEISYLNDDIIKIDSIFPVTSFLKKICDDINVKLLNIENVNMEDYTDDDNDYIIENLKDNINYELYERNLKLLILIKNRIDNIDINKSDLSKLFDELMVEFEIFNYIKETSENFKFDKTYLIKVFETKNLKEIPLDYKEWEIQLYFKAKKIKEIFEYKKHVYENMNHEFILLNISFEKILFPEIFNFESEQPVIDENINAYKKKYIQLSLIIHKSFKNYLKYLDTQYQMVNFIKYS